MREHHLVAAKKYGALPPHTVVRHLNGVKTDNRPENLVLGTTQENTMDHNSARLQAMFWREQYQCLLTLLRVTSDMVRDGSAVETIERAFGRTLADVPRVLRGVR